MLKSLPLVVLGVVSAVNAVPIYGECGGLGFTGSTVCDPPLVCVVLNQFYSQCLPLASESYFGQTTIKSTTQPVTSTTLKSTSSTPIKVISTTSTTTSTAPTSSCTQADFPDGSCGTVGNPYTGKFKVYLSPYYVAEVDAAIATQTSATLKTKSAAVAQIPNFTWLDTASKVPSLATYLADALSQQTGGVSVIVQIVIYDLPNRDCHAKASNGEFTIANNGVANYKKYIDAISAIVSQYPTVKVVAVVEPDSLANLITNLSDPNCANAQTAYLQCISYVIATLTQCNIWLYLDAGHAGWLGWPANLAPAAQIFSQLFKTHTPNRVRGLATNVANYNALQASAPDPITQGNPNYDEIHYINALAPLLIADGFPAHFIVDQGRSGVQNIRQQWGDWCNIKGAGFGLRPGPSSLSCYIDQIVWIKPGGECDGTSNSTAPRYDSTCSLSDAKQPSPQAGAWFEAYFEDLVTYANPAF